MALYLKFIDNNHLLEVGTEGLYRESIPERKQFNPGFEIGADFIDNHMTPDIDFATIHVYPEQWMRGADGLGQLDFIKSWIQSHIDDSTTILGKPLMVTKFGKSTKLATEEERNNYFRSVYNAIYVSARVGASSSGVLFWQLLADRMDNFRDGYEVVIYESPNIVSIISQRSNRISSLNNKNNIALYMEKSEAQVLDEW